jgi:hypothetical protein
VSLVTGVYTTLLTVPCIVTRYAPGTPAADGDVPLVGTPTSSICALRPKTSGEAIDGSDIQTSNWELFLPADCADLSGQDHVTTTVDGYTYELVGDPQVVRDPRIGLVHHVEAIVKRVF